jgi:hypothetical protein
VVTNLRQTCPVRVEVGCNGGLELELRKKQKRAQRREIAEALRRERQRT